MLKLGSHVSMSGKKMLLGSSEEAVSYGANTLMIYTGAPQNTRRKKIEDLNIEAGRTHMKENGIECLDYSEFQTIIEIGEGEVNVIRKADWTKHKIRVALKSLNSKEFIQEVKIIFYIYYW